MLLRYVFLPFLHLVRSNKRLTDTLAIYLLNKYTISRYRTGNDKERKYIPDHQVDAENVSAMYQALGIPLVLGARRATQESKCLAGSLVRGELGAKDFYKW